MKKRIISILIAVIMVISTLPLSASAYSGYDYASGTLGDRLNSIIQNGITGCVSPKIPAVDGRLNNSQWYTTSYANQSGSSQDKQCQAYARAAYSNLFGYNLATETYRVTYSDARARNYLDESLFRKYGVRCGAYLRTTDSSSGKYNSNKGHSIIILSYNSSGVITLEGNADGKGKVAITNYSWSSFNSMAFRRHNYYVCSFSQPTDAIYASLGSSSTPNPPPPSTPTLVSQTEGYWEVTIPANYNLLLYSSPDAASNLTNSKASSESYAIRVTNEARLSDGTVRYGRIWNHKGTDMMLWFTLTGSMTVEDVSHTTHVKGEFIRSDDVHPHYNYYRCSVCGEEFSDGSTSTAQNCSQCGTDLRIVSQEEVNWSIGIPANYVVEVYSEATATKWSFSYASYPETRYMRTTVRAEMSDGSIRFQEAGSEDRWFILADGMQIDTHIPGEVVYTKSGHPHENQVECAVCGLLYWDGSTTPNDLCTICNPEAEVISRESGKWEVTIPAYYFLQFYDTETTRKTSSYYDAKDAAYVLTSMERVTLSNGEVRYYFFHENDSGQTWSLWYIFTGNMTVEDVSHTVHTWDAGITTRYPTLDTECVRTYTCTICGTTKTESIPRLDPVPEPEPPVVSFTDVPSDAYYAEAVSWAVNRGITSGIGTGKFGPDLRCTRAQMVTFLWKTQGQPEPKSTNNPFVDVKPSDYCYKAVLWAVENNISGGTDSTHFSPSLSCDRAQAVTFIWRTEGRPEAETRSSFSDVSRKSYYAEAIDWAVEYKIVNGVGNGVYNPKGVCSRAQIVTMLYRDATN